MGGPGKQTATRRARNKVKGKAKAILAEAVNEGNKAVMAFLAGEPKLKLAQIVGKTYGGGYYDIKFGEQEPVMRGHTDMKEVGSKKVKHQLKKANVAELPKEGDFVIVEWDKEQAEKNEAIAAVNKKHKKAAANIIAVVPYGQEERVKKFGKWDKGGINAAINQYMGMAPIPENSAKSANSSEKRKTRKSKKASNNDD